MPAARLTIPPLTCALLTLAGLGCPGRQATSDAARPTALAGAGWSCSTAEQESRCEVDQRSCLAAAAGEPAAAVTAACARVATVWCSAARLAQNAFEPEEVDDAPQSATCA